MRGSDVELIYLQKDKSDILLRWDCWLPCWLCSMVCHSSQPCWWTNPFILWLENKSGKNNIIGFVYLALRFIKTTFNSRHTFNLSCLIVCLLYINYDWFLCRPTYLSLIFSSAPACPPAAVERWRHPIYELCLSPRHPLLDRSQYIQSALLHNVGGVLVGFCDGCANFEAS